MNDSKFWSTVKMIAIGLLIVFLIMVMSPGWSDEHNGDSDSDDIIPVDVQTTIGGDSTRLFSVGGSDMEISGCVATSSWLFGLRQNAKVVLDCEAVREATRLDKEGQHEAAAKMRCGTKLYRKRFGKGKTCIDAIKLSVPKSDNPKDDEEQIRYIAQQAELDYVQEQLTILVGQVEEQQRQIVEPVARNPAYSNKQRKAIEEIFKNEMGKD